MSNFIKGNQFLLFYASGTDTAPVWKALAYATSHSYSLNDEYEDIACKEFGLSPNKELTSSEAEVSGEYIYTDDAFKILSGMQESHKTYSFCFAKIADSTWDEKGYEISGATIGTIKKYFNGYVKVDVASETNSNATMSVTITGSGAVHDTAPTKGSTTFPLEVYTAQA